MRIVSLLPAATEMVAALGRLPVGVSHECDHPPAVADVPAVTRSRVDAHTTAGVNAEVAEAAADGTGPFAVDAGRLEALDPDLVVTQGTCDVCAVDASLVHEAVEGIDASPRVLEIDPHTLEEVFDAVRIVGEAAGAGERADRLLGDLRGRLDAVAASVPGDVARPRVAVLDWLDPLMVAGHWVPELAAAAGGEYGLADPGSVARVRDWDELLAYDPEVLVAAPCGLGVRETVADAGALTSRPGWNGLAAVRARRVHAMDGNAYLNRPGPRLVDAAEFLAGLFHPDRFPSPPPGAARSLVDRRGLPSNA